MKRYNAQEQQQLYEQWQLSGESKKVFAIRHGVSPSTFHYWVKKFGEMSSGKGFRSILVEDTALSNTATALIRYPSGITIEWYGPEQSVGLLKTLVS